VAEPAPAPDEARGPCRPGAGVAAVSLATCAAYATSFLGGWQFDDFRVIVEDARVRSLASWWASMPGIRPLLKLTYALNEQCGLGLSGFHAVNLAGHLAASVLVLLLLGRLGQRLELPRARWAAALGALCFALHPVQTEAVTYLSGRSSSLSAALALASAWTFLRGRDCADGWRVHLASPLLLAASLSVKEGAVVLPAALLLLEATTRGAFSWRASLRAIAVHLGVVAAAAAAFLAAPAYRRMLAQSLDLRGPAGNAFTQARAVAWLTGQLLPLHGLVAEPDLRPVTGLDPGPMLAALAVAGAAVAGLLLLRRRPVLAFAVLWYLLWLAPQGWWLPRPEPASERQLYLSLVGPAWLLGALLARLPGPRVLRPALAGALALGLGGATAARSLVYRDEVTFWSDAVAKAPGNARAHGNLGYALALACRTEEAKASLRRAASLDPRNPRPLVNLGLLERGELLPPEAAVRCAARNPP
jgi:hypothetical protein